MGIKNLYESVNLDVAKKLNKINYEQFLTLFNASSTKRHGKYNISGEFKKLKNYTSAIIKSKNRLEVQYNYAKGKTFGRLYANGASIQTLYNGFRSILVNDNMVDIDMVNAHPTILLNLCKKHNIYHNNLYNYINNRDMLLVNISETYNISRSEAKIEYLSSINSEYKKTKINKLKIKDDHLKAFDLEIKDIQIQLFDIYKEEFKDYISTGENIKGKFLNLILTKIENEYLNEILKIKGINPAVLMYDGLLSYKLDNKTEFLNNVNEYFKKYDITWDYKDCNVEMLELLKKMEFKDSDHLLGNNDIEIIDRIILNLTGKLVRCNGDIYYMGLNKIYSDDKLVYSELYKYISDQDYWLKGVKNDINVSKSHKHLRSLVDGVLLKTETNNNFINEVHNYTINKLFFNNGYYDFILNEFIVGEFNKTFEKIDNVYVKSNNVNVRKKIYEKIFNPIFTIVDNKDGNRIQLLNYFIFMTRKYLSGDVSHKRWTLLQGLRNSGKGIISDILMNCFGSYVKTTNSSNFGYKSNSGDSQKALSWVIDYRTVRICLTSEIDISDGKKIDGNMIKKFSSGGDYISARQNFKNEIEFKIQASLIVCCNDIPEIEPKDASDYCDEYQMKSKFIDSNFKSESKLDGYSYYKKDDDIKSIFLKRPDIITEFINIFLENNKHYNYPKIIKDELDDLDDDDYDKFFDLFDFDNVKDTDFISTKVLSDIIKTNKIIFSLKKCKTLLKTKGCILHRTSKTTGFKNIKLRELDQDTDEE